MMIPGVCCQVSNGAAIPTIDQLRTYLPKGGTVRDMLGQHRVEKSPGQFAITEPFTSLYANVAAAGCWNVVTLGFGDKWHPEPDKAELPPPEVLSAFAAFAAYVAKTVPALYAISIENELNGSFGHGTVAQRFARYDAMLSVAIPAIRAANPAVKIIAGASVGWNVDGWMKHLPHLAGADYLDIHPYLGADHVDTFAAQMKRIRQAGIMQPAWYTEHGGADAGKAGAAYWPLFAKICAADSVPPSGSNYFLLQATAKFPNCGLIDQAGNETAVGKGWRGI